MPVLRIGEHRRRQEAKKGYLSDMLQDKDSVCYQKIAREERKNGDELFYTMFGTLAAKEEEGD